MILLHRCKIRPVDPDKIDRAARIASGGLLGDDARHRLGRVGKLHLDDVHPVARPHRLAGPGDVIVERAATRPRRASMNGLPPRLIEDPRGQFSRIWRAPCAPASLIVARPGGREETTACLRRAFIGLPAQASWAIGASAAERRIRALSSMIGPNAFLMEGVAAEAQIGTSPALRRLPSCSGSRRAVGAPAVRSRPMQLRRPPFDRLECGMICEAEGIPINGSSVRLPEGASRSSGQQG